MTTRGIHDHDCVERGCRYVDGGDLALLLRVALGVVRRRRQRGQGMIYDDPVDAVEAVARKYAQGAQGAEWRST